MSEQPEHHVTNQVVLEDIKASTISTVKKLSLEGIALIPGCCNRSICAALAFIWWKTCEYIAETIAENKVWMTSCVGLTRFELLDDSPTIHHKQWT
jgi:hypothetical protein